MLEVLQADFARLPDLLGRVIEPPAPSPPLVRAPEPRVAAEPLQLGLF